MYTSHRQYKFNDHSKKTSPPLQNENNKRTRPASRSRNVKRLKTTTTDPADTVEPNTTQGGSWFGVYGSEEWPPSSRRISTSSSSRQHETSFSGACARSTALQYWPPPSPSILQDDSFSQYFTANGGSSHQHFTDELAGDTNQLDSSFSDACAFTAMQDCTSSAPNILPIVSFPRHSKTNHETRGLNSGLFVGSIRLLPTPTTLRPSRLGPQGYYVGDDSPLPVQPPLYIGSVRLANIQPPPSSFLPRVPCFPIDGLPAHDGPLFQSKNAVPVDESGSGAPPRYYYIPKAASQTDAHPSSTFDCNSPPNQASCVEYMAYLSQTQPQYMHSSLNQVTMTVV